MFSSLFLPIYNGIVFEVAVSQTKFELLVDIHEWLDPDIFEVNYRQKDEDEKFSDIQRMPVTWHVFWRGLQDYQKGKIQG